MPVFLPPQTLYSLLISPPLHTGYSRQLTCFWCGCTSGGRRTELGSQIYKVQRATQLWQGFQNLAPMPRSHLAKCPFVKMKPIFWSIYNFPFPYKSTRTFPEGRNEQMTCLPDLFWYHIWQAIAKSVENAWEHAWQKHFQVWSIFVFLRHLHSLYFRTNPWTFQIKTPAHRDKLSFAVITKEWVICWLNCTAYIEEN